MDNFTGLKRQVMANKVELERHEVKVKEAVKQYEETMNRLVEERDELLKRRRVLEITRDILLEDPDVHTVEQAKMLAHEQFDEESNQMPDYKTMAANMVSAGLTNQRHIIAGPIPNYSAQMAAKTQAIHNVNQQAQAALNATLNNKGNNNV